MKSLRFSALLFILGCIAMFIACNKEVASELPKQKSVEAVAETRGDCNVVLEDVFEAAVTSQVKINTPNPKFPASYTATKRIIGYKGKPLSGMTWQFESLTSMTFVPYVGAAGRLGTRLTDVTGEGKPENDENGRDWVPHHIVPTETSKDEPMVQQAGKMGFHMNEYYNGIWLPNYIGKAVFYAKNSKIYTKYVNDIMAIYYPQITAAIDKRGKRQGLKIEQKNKLISEECYKCLVCGVIPKIKKQIETLLSASQKVGGGDKYKLSAYNWPSLGYNLDGYQIK